MKITSRTPVRIDLAGGTLDIWPLYLFLKDALTINLGIDLFAQATLEETKGPSGLITLESLDLSTQCSLHWSEMMTAVAPPALDLHLRLLRHYAFRRAEHQMGAKKAQKAASLRDYALGTPPRGHLKLSTRALSPSGAGLGGSSSLCIAITGALSKWAHSPKEHLIDVVRDIETQVLGVPAGLQDYYGAYFGGLQRIRWRAGSHAQAHYAPKILKGIDKRILVFYSGKSRNSGINNWEVFKDLIDRKNQLQTKFETLAAATWELHEGLMNQDWKAVSSAISREWATRKSLAPGISTPEMENAFRIGAKEGASAYKVCGAGGGGCFFFFVESGDSVTKARIIQRVSEIPGIRHLPVHAVPHGLKVQAKG